MTIDDLSSDGNELYQLLIAEAVGVMVPGGRLTDRLNDWLCDWLEAGLGGWVHVWVAGKQAGSNQAGQQVDSDTETL